MKSLKTWFLEKFDFTIIILAIVPLMFIGSIVYHRSAVYGETTENTLMQKIESTQLLYDTSAADVVRIGKVSVQYRDEITEVTRAAVGGRYGELGALTVFQVLKNQNPDLDSNTYAKIKQSIESSRFEFKNNAAQIIKVRNAYYTALKSPVRGTMLALTGYPRIDLKMFDAQTVN
jgi:hypothetical protein